MQHTRRSVVAALIHAGTATGMGVGLGARHALAALPDVNAAFRKVLDRLGAKYLATINTGDAARFLSSQTQDGIWPDINYQDRSAAQWQPTRHLERTRSLAVAYNKAGHPLHHSAAAKHAVILAIGAWLARKPSSTNWWQNSIGTQLVLMPILTLMGSTMPGPLTSAATGLLNDPGMVPPDQATGQNLVWYATQQIVRGTLRENAEDVANASKRLQAEAAITTREGIQSDYSFHQHGPQLYSGGYGLAFLIDSVRIAKLLEDTPWAYASETIDTLSRYALEGLRPLIRGRWLDWSARGREFTRAASSVSAAQSMLPAIIGLTSLGAARGGELTTLKLYIESGAIGAPVLGNRHYWRSDFMVHQTPNGYFSVKMSSARTVGTESGNGENLLGYWLPFGITYLLRRGREYDGLPPIWDWSRLPGLTAPAEVPAFSGYQKHDSRFVGAVSNGNSGAAAMVLNKLGTSAKKAWFFQGDLMVALGCDVSSSRAAPVVTTINQTRHSGVVVTNQGLVSGPTEGQLLGQASWLWHDGITYLFPELNRTNLSLREVTGFGRTVNVELGGGDVTGKLLTLWVEHGSRPDNSNYAYGIWMGAPEAADAGRSPAFSILANDARQQSVRHIPTSITQAVFHEAGVVALDEDYSLRVDRACLLQAVPYENGWQVSISEPISSIRRVMVTMLNIGMVVSTREAIFDPGSPENGRSIQLPVFTRR